MSSHRQSHRVLTTLAAFVIVVAGMRAAEPLLTPFLLSALIAMICTPPLFWLQQKKVPTGLAVFIVVIAIMVVGLLLGTFVGSSLNDFAKAAPTYQARLKESNTALFAWLNNFGIDTSSQVLLEYFDPAKAMQMIATSLKQLGGVLTNTFLILLTVVFILLEASGLPTKLQSALHDPEQTLPRFAQISKNVKSYLSIKTIFSLITGVLVTLWLFILGVDFPILWGLIAFLLNYVPNIGSIIASVPAVLLAFVQFGLSQALLAAAGYVVINIVIGSILEPRFMGRGLGLSTLVVFVSLVFWGWVLGPIGMLLSVLLTMIIKIAMESNEETRWIGILLGSNANESSAAAKKTK
jgi:predicted PurR-regulated permease PerM